MQVFYQECPPRGMAKKVCQEGPSGRFGEESLSGSVLREVWRREFVRKDHPGGLAKKVCQEGSSGRFGIKILPGRYIWEIWCIRDWLFIPSCPNLLLRRKNYARSPGVYSTENNVRHISQTLSIGGFFTPACPE